MNKMVKINNVINNGINYVINNVIILPNRKTWLQCYPSCFVR
ncbi:unnamed protein product [marine sediment metagenome]|uniref:Uncharacterized protein n=1 Tax=marine sediment metagenome TaxID=412755 RepID=X1A0W4_9ZZZZ